MGGSPNAPERPGRRRPWLLAVAGLLVIGGAALLGAGRFLLVSEPLHPADVVLPLAGNRDRPAAAAELFGAGFGRTLAITGLPLDSARYRRWYLEDITRTLVALGVPEERIVIVPGIAETTFGELVNVRAFAEQQGWRSLILVTNDWHSRRTRILAGTAFRGGGIRIAVRGVPSPGVDLTLWWRRSASRRIVISEYLKLAAFFLGIR